MPGRPGSGNGLTDSEEWVEILREAVLMPDVVTEADQPTLIDVDVLEDRLILTYDSTPPTILAGAVLVGELGGSYMRRAR